MENTWLTKEVYQAALEEGRVYITGQNSGRNGVTMYKLYINKPTSDSPGLAQVRGIGNYWSQKKNCYWVTAWGTSRELEIILNVGYALGLQFHDIKQNWRSL
ncbi:MAG: hypothetical protein U1D67_06690 [Dehalococcoidia bacterium]|nr:hypothetical protein [Dehalococcoidia bacterium]